MVILYALLDNKDTFDYAAAMSELYPLALTFDDVLLLPGESSVLPKDAVTKTSLTADIELAIPVLSAAMDTVTEANTAVAMARFGGLGVIHRNFSPQAQATEVYRVKKAEGGMVIHPITVHPNQTIGEVLRLRKEQGISGFPVVEGERLVGIVTNRDFQFEEDLSKPVRAIMTPTEKLITVSENIGLEEAKKKLHENRIEKLPVVDRNFHLKGLITITDLEKARQNPHATKDALGRLRVGAAIGTGPDALKRAELLVQKEVDVIFIDTAHGHSEGVLQTLCEFKASFPQTSVIAGNIATEEAAKTLIDHGADAIKVGMGPGSICTTRIVAGVGVPQLTAIQNCAKVSRAKNIPIIADGGIQFSGDIVKALAAGSQTVMIGSLLAGTDEAPGDVVLYQGRSYKVYRGMGSLTAMQTGSRDRYFQAGVPLHKIVPEGIEGRVPYRGKLTDVVEQLVGGLKAGMGYVGAKTIPDLQNKAKFVRISAAGLKESHVHNVIITQEAPNYRIE